MATRHWGPVEAKSNKGRCLGRCHCCHSIICNPITPQSLILLFLVPNQRLNKPRFLLARPFFRERGDDSRVSALVHQYLIAVGRLCEQRCPFCWYFHQFWPRQILVRTESNPISPLPLFQSAILLTSLLSVTVLLVLQVSTQTHLTGLEVWDLLVLI